MPGFPLPQVKWIGFGTLAFLPGGKLYTYEAGTTNPLATYSDQALTVPNTNPIVLDAAGQATIFVEDGVAYKLVLTDENDVQIWSVDNISVPQVAAAPAASNVPVGGQIPYGGDTAPSGWLLCDGTAVSRTTYADLFAVIGTKYGVGNGSTTFNVPDKRGRFPLGKAAAGTGATIGEHGGSLDHTHTGPSHTHPVAAHSHSMSHTHTVPRDGWGGTPVAPVAGRLQSGGSGGGSEASVSQADNDNTSGASSAANTGTQALTTDAGGTGATGAANPAYEVDNWIIRYQA